MSDDKRARAAAEETLAPARNFTVTTEQRVRALAGPPAYVRRRRDIEDFERDAVEALRVAQAAAEGSAIRARALRKAEVLVARVNDLIDRHNRYYPSEANLPLHPRTGALLERGAPWTPMPPVTLDELAARARV
jgi:hypothetical protein